MDIDVPIGQVISSARERLQMSRHDLADKLTELTGKGVIEWAHIIARWECGRNVPHRAWWQALSEALQIPKHQLDDGAVAARRLGRLGPTSDRPWPPNLTDELRDVFDTGYTRRSHPDKIDQHLGLHEAMDELARWLDDPRDYQACHGSAWRSVIHDVCAAMSARGPALTAVTAALDSLRQALTTRSIGSDTALRHRCRELTTHARTELAAPPAVIAAFDDLVAALRSPVTPSMTIEDRGRVLDATLQATGRTLANEAHTLAGVLDNWARVVARVRHDLDGVPLPHYGRDLGHDAGLSGEERLALCRRLVAQPPPRSHHVIWVAYENARVASSSWRIELGPVTFFDGPTLLELLDTIDEEPEPAVRCLPEELLNDDEIRLPGDRKERSTPWPEGIRHWVAARVDLGKGRWCNPVSVAHDQADALLKLTSFGNGGTSWRSLWGHLHIVDGMVSASWKFMSLKESRWAYPDFTDDHLETLRPDLSSHPPTDDPRLRELIDAIDLLDATSSVSGSVDHTQLVQDVRIIELLATRCGARTWHHHLKRSFAVRWAHDKILGELTTAVADVLRDIDLSREDRMPQLAPLRARCMIQTGGRDDRVTIDHDVGLAAIPDLVVQLPEHHQPSRRLRTVAARLESPATIARWVDDKVAEYGHLIDRLARCRNSLAHGGPISVDVARSVIPFAADQAKIATVVGLRGILSGQSVREAHRMTRDAFARWRAHLASASSARDALLHRST